MHAEGVSLRARVALRARAARMQAHFRELREKIALP